MTRAYAPKNPRRSQAAADVLEPAAGLAELCRYVD